jgi:hypothetical protein
MSDISPQFEIVKSQTSIADYATPRYMSVEHFCHTYSAALSEVEIVGINGQGFVDFKSAKAKLQMLRAKCTCLPPGPA